MKMDSTLVDNFRKHLKSQGRSLSTVESYGRDASQFIDFINKSGKVDELFDPQTLVHFQDHLVHDRMASANTLRRLTISVRQFFRFLSEEEKIAESPFDLVAIPEREEGIPSEDELQRIGRLIEDQSNHQEGVIPTRNAAILCLLGLEGLKTSELIQLKWAHFFNSLADHATLHVESERKRAIELTPTSTRCMRAYKNAHDQLDAVQVKPLNQQNIFKAFKGRDGSLMLDKMSRHGLKFALYEIGKKVDFDHLNADLLRHHSIYYQLTEIDKPPAEVMNHLGLKRMGIIAKYNRLNRSRPDPIEYN